MLRSGPVAGNKGAQRGLASLHNAAEAEFFADAGEMVDPALGPPAHHWKRLDEYLSLLGPACREFQCAGPAVVSFFTDVHSLHTTRDGCARGVTSPPMVCSGGNLAENSSYEENQYFSTTKYISLPFIPLYRINFPSEVKARFETVSYGTSLLCPSTTINLCDS